MRPPFATPQPGAPARRVRDEAGAVAVMVGAISLVLVLVAAFAVDIGMQRVARRDMQALADVVALDLARDLDGRKANQYTDLQTMADAAAARNSGTLGDPPQVTPRLGVLDADGDFQQVSGATVPTAVEVLASTSVGFAFVPGSGGANRTAVGTQSSGACFVLGSYAARIRSGESPVLGPVLGALGTNVNLGVADYNGLVASNITLLGLLNSQLGVLTTSAALDGQQLVGLKDFYIATASVLERESGRTAEVVLLEGLAGQVDGSAKFRLSDILSVATGEASGLEADLNVLDLITGAAVAANGESGLEIPQLGVNLGPLANVQTSAKITDAPKMGCGRKNSPKAVAETAQVRLDLSAAAADVAVPGLLKTNVSLAGYVSVASAKGQLTDVRCDPTGITVAVSDGLVNVDLTLQVTVSLRILGLGPAIPVVRGPITIRGQTTSTGDAVVNIVNDDYDTPTRIPNTNSGLPNLTVNTAGLALIGLPLGVVLAPITNLLLTGLVNPLVQALDASLLTPVLTSLGVELSGADVFARPTPKCDQPALRG